MDFGLSSPIQRLAGRFPSAAKFAIWVASKLQSRRRPHWLIRRIAREVNYRVPVDARLGNGMTLRLVWTDEVGVEVITKGFYELDMVRVFQSIVGPNMVFFDVGAQVGQYTLLAAAAGAVVHSFEPDPATYRLLEHNVRTNRLTNVHLNSCALAEVSGDAIFYPSTPENIGKGSLRTQSNFSGAAFPVACLTLDDYVQRHGIDHIDLIKMDVEGAELHVLRGASKTLSASRKPRLLIEFLDSTLDLFGDSCAKLAEHLQGAGYKLFRIEPTGPVPLVVKQNGTESANVLAVPQQDPSQQVAEKDAVGDPSVAETHEEVMK
jgi:FkbM family methyltransferase